MGVTQLLLSYGSSLSIINVTLSTTYDVSLRAIAIDNGWNGISPIQLTVTIPSGVIIGSQWANNYAVRNDVAWPAGSSITLINNGYISGKGGDGANFGPNNGQQGGHGLYTTTNITIYNNGTIQGGGGGGGAGQSPWGGGGGGAGFPAGVGGIGGGYDDGLGPNGRNGTLTTGGIGGYYYGGAGGNAGGSGGNSNTESVGYGGAGGEAVRGNAYITWGNQGTLIGVVIA